MILVDKNAGATSHDVVSALRRLTRIRAVGHTGTLDPMATGLLVICLGAATKLSAYLTGQTKEYLGTVTFGAVTDTLDATGEVLERRAVPGDLDGCRIERAMESLTGEIEQTPPMTSAVKVDGVRLHRLARKGLEVKRRTRSVRVDIFELIRLGDRAADFRVVCSSGTYVRSLASELGEHLGFGGHLSALRRVRVGSFDVQAAHTLDELREMGAMEVLARHVVPAARAVGFLPSVVLDEVGMRALRSGGVAAAETVVEWEPGLAEKPGALRVMDESGGLSAIGAATGVREDGGPTGVRPVRVLAD